jgi:tRNA nucleotidyltransferase/poly(A) polymerase
MICTCGAWLCIPKWLNKTMSLRLVTRWDKRISCQSLINDRHRKWGATIKKCIQRGALQLCERWFVNPMNTSSLYKFYQLYLIYYIPASPFGRIVDPQRVIVASWVSSMS